MSPNIRKNRQLVALIIIIFLISIGLLLSLPKKETKLDKISHKEQEDRKTVATKVLYDFLALGIENNSMPPLNGIDLSQVFYSENKTDHTEKYICASYQLTFVNGNHPTWETCFKTTNSEELPANHQTIAYLGMLTKAALQYQAITENSKRDNTYQITVLDKETIEKNLNKKLTTLKGQNQQEPKTETPLLPTL